MITTVLTIFIGIASLLLILVVLVQNSKGGGLASNFSGSNQYMGVRKTTAAVEKITWALAIGILVLSLGASASISKSNQVQGLDTELIDDLGATLPAMPATPIAPAQQTTPDSAK